MALILSLPPVEYRGFRISTDRILKGKLLLLFHIVFVHVNASSKNLKLNLMCSNHVPELLLLITKPKINSIGKDKGHQFKVNYS